MTNSIGELEEADCTLVTGSNTTETHPVISTRLKRAVRLHHKSLIVIDPRRLDLVRHATIWLRQHPGTDVAVINGLMHVIIEENLHDQAYIAQRTENFAALRETVASYTPEYVEQISGVPAAELRRAARHPYTQGLLRAFPSVHGGAAPLASIPGAPPSLENPPSGCRFHPRCGRAVDLCRGRNPELVQLVPGHSAACHLAE